MMGLIKVVFKGSFAVNSHVYKLPRCIKRQHLDEFVRQGKCIHHKSDHY